MEVNLGETQIVELQATYSPEQIQGMALGKRVDAFGQVAKLLQRPRPEDIEIVAMQKQYEPFWHVAATSHYIYERKHTYRLDVSAPEVQTLIIQDKEYAVVQSRTRGTDTRGVDIDAMERCEESLHRDLTLDAQTGEEVDFRRYLTSPQLVMPDIATLQHSGAVVVLPEVRSSFVVRRVIPMLMKTFQADRVLEETVNVETITLCFRPTYAVEYAWAAKQKRQVLVFDALSGVAKPVSGELKKQMAKVLDNDALFDIGADAIGTIIPGANVAIKLGRFAARKAINAE
jgi:hypothetical protein